MRAHSQNVRENTPCGDFGARPGAANHQRSRFRVSLGDVRDDIIRTFQLRERMIFRVLFQLHRAFLVLDVDDADENELCLLYTSPSPRDS